MEKYLDLSSNKIYAINYKYDPNRIPDQLEWSLIQEISRHTGFFLARIHITKASRCKYSRKIDYFEFEYDGKQYILEKGKIKEGSN